MGALAASLLSVSLLRRCLSRLLARADFPLGVRRDRIVALERDRAKIVDRVKMLQKKSDADDRLVDALRSELQVREVGG